MHSFGIYFFTNVTGTIFTIVMEEKYHYDGIIFFVPKCLFTNMQGCQCTNVPRPLLIFLQGPPRHPSQAQPERPPRAERLHGVLEQLELCRGRRRRGRRRRRGEPAPVRRQHWRPRPPRDRRREERQLGQPHGERPHRQVENRFIVFSLEYYGLDL